MFIKKSISFFRFCGDKRDSAALPGMEQAVDGLAEAHVVFADAEVVGSRPANATIFTPPIVRIS